MSTTDKVNQFARKVWLAGLGAYGKSADVVTDKLDKAYEESNQLFNDLVGRGTEIQAGIDEKLKQNTLFERKVDEVREKLGLNQSVSSRQVDELTDKVDALTAVVAQLAEKKLAQKQAEAAEATAKPTRTRKTTAKTKAVAEATEKSTN